MPTDALVNPLPRELTTPPVTNMCLATKEVLERDWLLIFNYIQSRGRAGAGNAPGSLTVAALGRLKRRTTAGSARNRPACPRRDGPAPPGPPGWRGPGRGRAAVPAFPALPGGAAGGR